MAGVAPEYDVVLDEGQAARFCSSGCAAFVLDHTTGVRRPSTLADLQAATALLDETDARRPHVDHHHRQRRAARGARAGRLLRRALRVAQARDLRRQPLAGGAADPDDRYRLRRRRRTSASGRGSARCSPWPRRSRSRASCSTSTPPRPPAACPWRSSPCRWPAPRRRSPWRAPSCRAWPSSWPRRRLSRRWHPGARLIMGSSGSVMDMRSAGISYAAPEAALMNAACVEVAHHLGFPATVPGLATDAKYPGSRPARRRR